MAIIEEDILIRDDTPGFEWSVVLAGAVIGAAVTFFLIVVGAALGLSLAGTRNLTGGHSFLTIGAIYFLAAQTFGFAIGGHITGRLMTPAAESEDEHFRADVHGLGVWGICAVLGFGLVAITAAAGFTPAARAASQPMAYWADKLLTGAPVNDYAIRNDEISRLLAADIAGVQASPAATEDRDQLVALVAAQNNTARPLAAQQVDEVEARIRADADAVRHTALYLAMWSALALLLGAFAAVMGVITARWHTEKDYREYRIWKRS